MCAGIERRARGRAAVLISAQVGPVAPVLDAQDVQHVDPGHPRRGTQRPRHLVDQRPGTKADRHQRGQPLRADDADGVRGDVRGDSRTGRIGQVVAERDLDPVVGRLGPDHNQAGLRHEAEQVRHDREQRLGRSGPDLDRVRLERVRGLRGARGLKAGGCLSDERDLRDDQALRDDRGLRDGLGLASARGFGTMRGVVTRGKRLCHMASVRPGRISQSGQLNACGKREVIHRQVGGRFDKRLSPSEWRARDPSFWPCMHPERNLPGVFWLLGELGGPWRLSRVPSGACVKPSITPQASVARSGRWIWSNNLDLEH